MMIAACNAVGANCWLNMPFLSTNAYVTSEATLVKSLLNPGLKAIVEYGNEVWNNYEYNSYIQGQIYSAGQAAFPVAAQSNWSSTTTYASGNVVNGSNSEVYTSTASGNLNHNPVTDGGVHWSDNGYACSGVPFTEFSYQFAYGILRAAQNGNTFASVMGSPNVVRILGSQNAYYSRSVYQLDFLASNCGGNGSLFSGTAAANADAMATAPYFGGANPLAWTTQSDGGLTYLFTEQNSGGILPDGAGTGNCGNLAGNTCGTSTAVTLTSSSGSVPSTPSNGTCEGMYLTNAIGTSATLAVDGGTAFLLTDQYGDFAIASLAVNAGGTGYAVNDTVTLLGGSPKSSTANVILKVTGVSGGAITSFSFNYSGQYAAYSTFAFTQGSTSGSGTGATFNSAVWTGSGVGYGASATSPIVFCFTNATSAGAVAAAWRWNSTGKTGGWIASATAYWACDAQIAAGSPGCEGYYSPSPLALYAYESGFNYIPGNDATYETWYYAAARDARMGTAYTNYYTAMLSSTPTAPINVFIDITAFSQYNVWGDLENITQTTSPRFQATSTLQ
jgi:hypothetical protein